MAQQSIRDALAPWAEPVPGAPYPMTVDELLRWPDDGQRHELMSGRLVRMSPTSDEHFWVMDNLHPALREFVKARDFGIVTYPDTGFQLSVPGQTDTVFAPDIAFVRKDRVPPRRKKFLPLAPDLAVEIVSPTQYRPEMAQKARLYLQAGVRLVWIIWPDEREVDIWRPGLSDPTKTLTIADTLDGEDVLPGFTMLISELFG